jgi:beta-N-acetylhexosaminidase
MNTGQRILTCIIALALLFSNIGALPAAGQTATPARPKVEPDLDAQIEAILAELSVEERVGQLFIVSFVGQFAGPEDAISALIRDYKIGGVVLLDVNNNIDNEAEDTVAQVANLTNQLQTRAYEATQHDDFFLPLFVAIDHEGDGFPRTHLRNGFTSIPSQMALGATWRPEDAEAVGSIIGQELAAVGINMLLGPVVDVLEKPRPEGSGDMNIRVFGGSPFWVGQMGRAYVRGVHEGSGGRVLTVAKHFPGHGASDRLPDDEVATVQKSLAELQQSDLLPFFAVTRPAANDPLGVTDAMMPSHIRYKGFQGDVDQLTRPISLDREGMAAFMALAPLAEWRQEGLIVCDSLGVRAVKGYYDPTFQTFPAKQIAKDALMAGNDVLPLVSFAPTDRPGWFDGQRPTIQETITFFQEEYHQDELFRQRVDDAVRHILRAKLRLYPTLGLDKVLVTGNDPTGQGGEVVAQVARHTLTLLYPPVERPEDLSRRLPAPPRPDEDIVIMGCFEGCLAVTRLRGETIRDALLDLYGPGGSGLIAPEQIHLVNFDDLYRLLTGDWVTVEEEEQAHAQAIVEQIQAADWIVLVLINYMPDTYPQSGAARLFLRDPSVSINGVTTHFDLRDIKIVALALHAPYYLDATEIGKLSAYWAVYSKVEPSLQVALRAWFQELAPASASPVSVEGIGYDLATALQPAPDQTLALLSDPLGSEKGDAWHPGDELRVRVGPILDSNGHPVPDGASVRFQGTYTDLPISLAPRTVTDTLAGVAWAVFRPTDAGRLEISASADGLQIQPMSLLIAPLAPTSEPQPSATATLQVEPQTFTPTVSPTHTPPSPTNTIASPIQTSSPTPAATGPVAASQPGKSFPVLPLIVLGGLLALGGLGFLWYRGRSAAPEPALAAATSMREETGTVSADLAALSPPLTGRTLGSCQVGQKLGEGGMGQVYKGYHPLLDRSVAIKILPPALVESEEMRARFLQEARIAAALRHPNIVQVFDFGETENLIYMIMEFIDGVSLKGRLTEASASGEMLPVDEAVQIARQVATGLAYAHAHGAVHRDLKPANILINREGQAILVDFGLAVLRGGPRYTEPGRVWGSPTYIAPEQLSDPPRFDARSDIYSLGVMLYEMLTGRPPFKADSVMEVLWQQANVTPRPPRQLAPDVPPELETIVLRALSKNPAERFQTAQELADALADF